MHEYIEEIIEEIIEELIEGVIEEIREKENTLFLEKSKKTKIKNRPSSVMCSCIAMSTFLFVILPALTQIVKVNQENNNTIIIQ